MPGLGRLHGIRRLYGLGPAGSGELNIGLPRYMVNTPATIYHEFDAATGISHSAGTGAINNSEFVSGTGSYKGTSALGTKCEFEQAVNWDMSACKNIAIWLYIHSDLATTYNGGTLFLSNTNGGFADYFTYSFPVLFHAGWNVLYPQAWAVGGGSPSFANPILRYRIRLTAKAATTFIGSVDRWEGGADHKAAVMITLDDGAASVYNSVLPVLRERNLRATAYVITGQIGNAGIMTSGQLQELNSAGWDVGNHTSDHTDLTTLSQADAQTKLTAGKAALDGWGLTRASAHVAYPFGGRNATVIAAMTAAGMLTGRNVAALDNLIDYTDPFDINGRNIDNNTTLAAAKTLIDNAITNQRVVTLLFHDVGGAGNMTLANFTALMDYIRQVGIQSLTISEFYALRSSGITVNHY